MADSETELLEQDLVERKIERRFICDICQHGFKRKEHLVRHKLSHQSEKPHVCSVCWKGFRRKEHLNLHFVIHTGEKTEICGECGKGFHRKDHLRKHRRSHITKRAKEQAAMAQAILKAGGTQEDVEDELRNGMAYAQVTLEVGTGGSSDQIQIQVPQYTIQLSNSECDEDAEQQIKIEEHDLFFEEVKVEEQDEFDEEGVEIITILPD